MAVTKDELIAEYGMTAEEIHKLELEADDFDRGIWPAGTVVHRGRPALSPTEDAQPVTIRIPESQIEAIDEAAKKSGTTRSGAIRAAIDYWLKTAAVL